MNKMILGRYVPGDSLIHRLDPRSKLLAMILFIMIVFWANNVVTNALIAVFIVGIIVLSGIRLLFFLDGLKPMIGLILFTTLFQLLFTQGGQQYFHWGIVSISQEGVRQALLIFARFLWIIFFSTLLTLTTTPLSLADAVESLLKPLKPLGVPTQEVGLMLSLSLRFVPTLMDDTTQIINAQKARGVDFGEGGLIRRVRAIIPILIPLFVISFKRAFALATAMEARGYQGGDQRTKYRQLSWKWKDTFVLISMLVLGVVLNVAKN